MGRMHDRVLGLVVVLAIALVAPSVASAAPNGAISGWRSPAGGSMEIRVQATPDSATGAALRSATATLGNLVVTEAFADGTCSETCPAVVKLTVDTLARTDAGVRQVAEGEQWLVVTIEDVNSSKREIRQLITVDNTPPPNNPTVVVQIGSGLINPPASPPDGGVGGEEGPSCRSPQLSMRLAERPLRFRRGVPVLKRGRSYRFEGRLTCRINGVRRGAPRGMEVQIRNRLRGWTLTKPSVHVRKQGEIVARLAYRSSRVIIFRVRGANGDVARVRIKVRVVRR